MRFITWAAMAIAAATAGAQPAIKPSTVDTSVNHAAALAVADLNRDGRPDLIAASWGNPPSGADFRGLRYALALDDWARSWECLAVDPSYQPMGADAADIDGDDTMDVVACSWGSNDVAWWRNDGSDPIAWTRHDIDTGFTSAHEVHAIDIDKDGDLDVAAASAGLNQVKVWYNQGGSPPSWFPQVVDGAFGGARSVAAADFDGDGDIDLAGAALADNEVCWWRNDGGWPITWTYQGIDAAFPMAHRLNCCDVDRDGRIDLVGAGYNQGIAWWRNTPGSPVHWIRQDIEAGYPGAMVAHAADMDGDGDIDVIGTNQLSNEVCVWENLSGEPSVWQKHTRIYPGPWPIIPYDLDRDGDPDMVTGGYQEATQMINLAPLRLCADPPFLAVVPGDSAVLGLYLPLRYGHACRLGLSVGIAFPPVNGSIALSVEKDSLTSPDSCRLTLTASADASPGLYPVILRTSDGRDTLTDTSQVSIEILGQGQAAAVGASRGMIDLARLAFATVDSLWSVPSNIGSAYQALIIEKGAVPSDTAKLNAFITAGGRVLLTSGTPQDLCGSTSLISISSWIGASNFGTYTGSGIAVIATYEQPFGTPLHINDTLGTAVNGFGRLANLGSNGIRIARLGSNNAVLASVYCASGAGHCLYFTGGAGLSPESDSLLAGFLRNPMLGVDEVGPDKIEPGPTTVKLLCSPNPWQRELDISYYLVKPGLARLQVFNITGQQVRKWECWTGQAGWHTIRWTGIDENGRPLPCGAYFARLRTAEGTVTRKLLMVK